MKNNQSTKMERKTESEKRKENTGMKLREETKTEKRKRREKLDVGQSK